MRMFRNVFRRKMRAFLTIFGITIGVFALVVMGSMAEKINLLIDGGTRYYSDKVVIADASTPTGGFSTDAHRGEPHPGDREGPRRRPGQRQHLHAAGRKGRHVHGRARRGSSAATCGARATRRSSCACPMAATSPPATRGKAVVGCDMAKALGAKVGGTIHLRGKPFEVVGIYDKTLTAPDNTVVISLRDVQQLLYAQLPVMVQQQVNPDQLATSITAYPDAGVDPDQLASTIEGTVSNVTRVRPAGLHRLSSRT